MGWGRLFLFGNIGQQLDIQDLQDEIQNLRDESFNPHSAENSQTTERDIVRLKKENQELRLYLVVLVRSLIAKGIVTREEIEKMVAIIDAEDGCVDGGYKGSI
jgi:hypothetical protein